jgi:hypothetical protein
MPDSDWVDYIPDALDNRSDPDPIVCEIRPMSVRELRAMQSTYGSRLAGKNAGKRMLALFTRLATERVRNIRNCHVWGDITTGAELAERGPPALFDDIVAAIVDLSHLQEGLAKKSSSPSDSSPAETGP